MPENVVGFEHLRSWERMALVTDAEWIGHTVKAFGWMMPGEVRIFSVSERADAESWVVTDGS